jgi:hypothetical protein
MLASMSVPMATTGDLEVLGAELHQGLGVRGVHLHGVRQPAQRLLDDLRVGVHAEDLVAELDERVGEGGAEASQADHDHLAARRGQALGGGARLAPEREAVVPTQ